MLNPIIKATNLLTLGLPDLPYFMVHPIFQPHLREESRRDEKTKSPVLTRPIGRIERLVS